MYTEFWIRIESCNVLNVHIWFKADTNLTWLLESHGCIWIHVHSRHVERTYQEKPLDFHEKWAMTIETTKIAHLNIIRQWIVASKYRFALSPWLVSHTWFEHFSKSKHIQTNDTKSFGKSKNCLSLALEKKNPKRAILNTKKNGRIWENVIFNQEIENICSTNCAVSVIF